MRARIALALLLFAAAAGAAVLPGTPRTTNNDDSCDVAVMPAATLLLPYFEVDFFAPATRAVTTLFTITNVTRIPQIAHVTMWTDYGFPIVDFNIFLTGYDVQAINLYDILNRGMIAPPNGTSNETTPGDRSLANTANPKFLPNTEYYCVYLPGYIPQSLLMDMRNALTNGDYTLTGYCPRGTPPLGGRHANAVGFVTVDVINTCSTTLPTDSSYYTNEIAFDNVLIGDWMLVNPAENYASGNPMVHIRATPEDGATRDVDARTNLPFTFYDRYTPATKRRLDRRQPLPVAWAARFIQGGPGAFNTELQIWREGKRNGTALCRDYEVNAAMPFAEVVRFDEHENATAGGSLVLPLTSSTPTSSTLFPPMTSPAGDVGGWLYLNTSNGGSAIYSSPRAGQSWVTVRMSAEGRYSSGADALPLGNGCSPAPAVGGVIGPAPNETP